MTTSLSRRVFLGGAGAVVLGASCSRERTAGDQQAAAGAASRRRTFVLLHGSWHGGWCWARVAEPLRAQGHRVYTPTLTGLGERSHLLSRDVTLDTWVTDLVNVLEWEDLTDVVLVAHSFGGVVVTGAADRAPRRISHLVYLDSLILRDGESAFSTFPPDEAAARRKLAEASPGGLSVAVPPPSVFGVTDPGDGAWLQARCTPHPLATYENTMTLKNPVGNGKPATYIAMKPDYASTAAGRTLARAQPGWRYVELDGAHDAMVTAPQAVIDEFLKI